MIDQTTEYTQTTLENQNGDHTHQHRKRHRHSSGRSSKSKSRKHKRRGKKKINRLKWIVILLCIVSICFLVYAFFFAPTEREIPAENTLMEENLKNLE